MSDATLPPPRSSSKAPTARERNRSNSSQSETDFDTSMEHKSSSVTGEAASGDSERADGKQRRKRTSPTDQAVLEAEYKRNPKPNKAARAEIVEKVTLNEKEVQIWFQNRRQINRRKSRPLLPHEIAAFGLGGMAALSSDPITGIASCTNSEAMEARSSSQEEAISSQEEVGCPEGSEATEPVRMDSNPGFVQSEAKVDSEEKLPSLNRPNIAPEVLSSITTANESTSFTESVTKSFSSTPGYLANRWNNISSSFSTPASSQAPTFLTPPISSANHPSSCPERIGSQHASTPSSQMRLSMSLDGKAELVSWEPSPPREIPPRPASSCSFHPQKRMRTLERSQSALPLSFLPRQGASITPFAPRLPTGRSRDARSWEFCCDSDARDELTTQAENESTGSALAAISLLRSTSNSALKSNTNKRNAPTTKHDPNKHGKKPKLGRVTSSMARLQNPVKELSNSVPDGKSSYGKDGLMRSPSGESDKENWIPHENGGNSRRRPLPTARSNKQSSSRAVLGDNFNVPTHALNFGGPAKRRRKGKDVTPSVFEDQENTDVGGEVEKFMRGEISPSKKGDLDCIQGLLSLSQGNWR
ncbi:hypothetical protein G7Y89_g11003 [Cudoniella acicularis]|uniref:Homeobox domain-containing protein n=1 Tax=Cudoniella acicularis TaxID=354080 RepID=A0A8H4RBM8_9HELO|nr:hypothetical protein G7Y89_g11003 [Cudoniella acicularis]